MAKPDQTFLNLRLPAEELASPLPALLVEARRIADNVAHGEHGRRRVGRGESFWQFRRYQSGDPASAIDWRQSARSQPVYVRESEWTAAQSLWIWIDLSPSMNFKSDQAEHTKLDRAGLIGLALASLLVRAGERIAALGFNRTAYSGSAAVERFAATLDKVRSSDRASLPEVVDLPQNAQIVLLGDFLSPVNDTTRMIKGFSKKGISGHMLQISDPAEQSLPYAGKVRFLASEDEDEYVAGRVESLRPAYRERRRTRNLALSNVAGKAGWTFATYRTDNPVQTALLALYRQLVERHTSADRFK